MKKNSRIKIQKYEGRCAVVAFYSGKILHQFEIHDNLDSALSLLKKINRVKNFDGSLIYEMRMVQGVSAWSFHQSRLFWENLRYFITYEPLIKEVLKNNYTVVLENELDLNMLRVLKESGVQLESKTLRLKQKLKQIKIFFADSVLRTIAKIYGYFSLIYTKLMKRNILVYSPDKFDHSYSSDFRMREIYKFFRSHQIPIIEIFHSTLGLVFLKNIFQRKRVGLYLGSLPFAVRSSPTLDRPCIPYVTDFPSHQQKYIDRIVRRFDEKAKSSILEVLTLKRILKFIGITKFITIDDMRSVQEVIVASRSLGIRSYGFQHGHVNKYHTGHMNYEIPETASAPFDRLFMWNEYWRSKLISSSTMYTPQNVMVGGYIRPPIEIHGIPIKREIPSVPTELSVLVANDTWAPREEVRFYLNRLLDMGCTLYLSMRSDLPTEKQLADFGLGDHTNVFLCKGADPNIIKKIDCVVGVYSTYLYEMMYYNLPIFTLATSFTFGDDLIIDNLAGRLERDFIFSDIKNYLDSFSNKRDVVWPKQDITIDSTLKNIFNLN